MEPHDARRESPFALTAQDRTDIALSEVQLQIRRSFRTGLLVGVLATILTAAALGGLGYRYLEDRLGDLDRSLGNVAADVRDARSRAGRAERQAELVITALARTASLPGDDPVARAALSDLLPADVLAVLDGQDDIAALRYADFDNRAWVFIPDKRLGWLDFNLARALNDALAKADATMVPELRP